MPTTEAPPRSATSRTEISVAVVDGRLRVDLATDTPPERPVLRPVLVSSDHGCARVALVPDGALLLAGDHIRLVIRIGAGAGLDLLEPSGTVAYDMRGEQARWDVDVHVDRGAALVWRGEPFVVAAGADVLRTTRITVAPGACVAVRETLVLGRHAEVSGRIAQHTDVSLADGTPLLVEHLALAEGTLPLMTGGRRVLGSVLAHGVEVPGAAGPERFDLESADAPSTVLRRLEGQAHRAVDHDTWRHLVAAVLDGP